MFLYGTHLAWETFTWFIRHSMPPPPPPHPKVPKVLEMIIELIFANATQQRVYEFLCDFIGDMKQDKIHSFLCFVTKYSQKGIQIIPR